MVSDAQSPPLVFVAPPLRNAANANSATDDIISLWGVADTSSGT